MLPLDFLVILRQENALAGIESFASLKIAVQDSP
jgi:hypothetical protein